MQLQQAPVVRDMHTRSQNHFNCCQWWRFVYGAGLQTAVVVDASSGSSNRSVLAVGPGASSVINSFTHRLKIYDD